MVDLEKRNKKISILARRPVKGEAILWFGSGELIKKLFFINGVISEEIIPNDRPTIADEIRRYRRRKRLGWEVKFFKP